MMSSSFCTSICFETLVMPPDSIWKRPIVSPRLKRAKVAASSSGISLSEKSGARWRISVSVSSITVSVFSPRKSIFSRPRSFSGPIAYWLTISLPFESRQSGTYSDKIAIADHDTGGVDAGVARKAFEQVGVFPELARRRFGLDRLLQVRRFLRRGGEGDVQLVRDHLRDPVAVAVAQAHDAADIAHHAFRFQFSEGDDLRDAAFAVFLPDVFEHFAAARFAKIDVDIRAAKRAPD